MLNKIVRLLMFLAFTAGLLLSTPLMSQVNDAGLWTSMSFDAKVVKKLSLTLSQEFRFNENITELGTSFTESGLTYKLNKHLQIAVNYRFTQQRKLNNYYTLRNRFYADFKYNHKIKPFALSWRARFQNQIADLGRASDGGVPEYYFRNKLSAKWDFNKPFEPYISFELFSPLKFPRTHAFDNMRGTAGVEYEFSKHHKIDVYYMIQRELNVSNPETDFIIGLGYAYKL